MNQVYRLIALTLLLLSSISSLAKDSKDACSIPPNEHQQRQLVGFLLLDNEDHRPGELDLKRTHLSQKKASAISEKPVTENHLELLRSSDNRGSDLLITLYLIGKEPRVIAIIALHRNDRENGGFSSFDRLRLQWPEIEPHTEPSIPRIAWPEFFITQTSLPAKGDRHFRPGPPQTLRYRYQAPCYQQAFLTEG